MTTLTLEKQKLTLGFVPLMDCAPLVIAREKGFFNEEGLEVVLSAASNWASIRDKVAFGLLDGAHMLSPMPLASTLGLGCTPVPMITAMALSLNGNAITLSSELYHALQGLIQDGDPLTQTGLALKEWISTQPHSIKLATVFPYSCHHYQLRYWLKNAGIDPDKDLQLVAIPPTRMVKSLAEGKIDGFCVGEPWNSLAEQQGIGNIIVTGYQIWPNTIEKVFAVTEEWATRHPNTHLALLRALSKACQWLDNLENHEEMLQLMGLPPYLDKTALHLQQAPSNHPIRQEFYQYQANRPKQAHALMLLKQMKEWGQLPESDLLENIAKAVYRDDIYDDLICSNNSQAEHG